MFKFFPLKSKIKNKFHIFLTLSISLIIVFQADVNAQLFSRENLNKSQFFHKEPYLIFTPSNSEMRVLWQLNQSHNCKIEWGKSLNYELGSAQTTEYGNDHQHKFVVKNLENDTRYFYRVINQSDTINGEFMSAPSPTNTNLTFFAYGDTRTYPWAHNDVAAQILAEIENDASAHTFIVSSGDFVSNGNKEFDWDSQFFDFQLTSIRKMMRELPYLGSMGNHEGNGELFGKYFPYPFYTSGKYYWSFDYGPAHFTIIDQFTNYKPGSVQYDWIVNDLASTDKSWKFILLHKPGWSAGGGHSNNSNVQDYIQPLCEQYGVQMVIGGHNHYYSCALNNGVVHITAGGGGAPLYNPDDTYPKIIKVNKSLNFCKIQIIDNQLEFLAIDQNGSIIHQFNYNELVSGINDAHIIEDVNVFPNPFSKNINISFRLIDKSFCKISVFNAAGKLIKVIANKELNAGEHEFSWDGNSKFNGSLVLGVYYLRLEIKGKDGISKKLIRLKNQ